MYVPHCLYLLGYTISEFDYYLSIDVNDDVMGLIRSPFHGTSQHGLIAVTDPHRQTGRTKLVHRKSMCPDDARLSAERRNDGSLVQFDYSPRDPMSQHSTLAPGGRTTSITIRLNKSMQLLTVVRLSPRSHSDTHAILGDSGDQYKGKVCGCGSRGRARVELRQVSGGAQLTRHSHLRTRIWHVARSRNRAHRATRSARPLAASRRRLWL